MIHHDALCLIAIDAGLADDAFDATAWLEAHGICAEGADQYAEGIRQAALASGHDLGVLLRGIFHSGLTLGIAVGEHIKEAA